MKLTQLLTFCLLFCTSSTFANWHQHTFNVMGTEAHVEFWLEANDSSPQAQKLIEQVVMEMQRIDNTMSPYKEDSELSRINRLASKEAIAISSELFDLISDAQSISQMTQGAFDITYASIGYQYDYRAHKKPDNQSIQAALGTINYQSIKLNKKDNTLFFTQPNIKIDLGGIAKGHAVKNCIDILKNAHIKHALISAGGDTTLLGDKQGRPWYVGIKHPRAEDKTAVHIPLENESISTSGDYERFFIEDGVRYHHIINPKTGDSAREVVSVSIIGKNPTYVDALSTAVFVMGLQKGLDFINQYDGYDAIIIDNAQTLHASKGLQ